MVVQNQNFKKKNYNVWSSQILLVKSHFEKVQRIWTFDKLTGNEPKGKYDMIQYGSFKLEKFIFLFSNIQCNH